jgi:uncharacterized protein YjdB
MERRKTIASVLLTIFSFSCHDKLFFRSYGRKRQQPPPRRIQPAVTTAPASAATTASTHATVTTATQPTVTTATTTAATTTAATTTAATTTATQPSATTTVSVPSTPIVPLGVTLDKDAHTLFLGSTLKLNATVLPASAVNKAVNWSSSNTAVAIVDANGQVSAKSEGNATISVTTQEANLTATCQITVKKLMIAPINPIVIGPVKVTGVRLDRTMLDMTVGGFSTTLKPQIEPAQAQNKQVTWVSSNPAVATVDETGKVTPLKAGSARITVKTVDGGFTASSNVYVETPNVEGSTSSNLLSGGGNMTFQGGWIYFAAGSSGLHKMRLDGTRLQQLSEDKAFLSQCGGRLGLLYDKSSPIPGENRRY